MNLTVGRLDASEVNYSQGNFLDMQSRAARGSLTFFFFLVVGRCVYQESIFKIMQRPNQHEVAANPRMRAG